MILLLAGCGYVVDLDDTGVRSWTPPTLELSSASADFGAVAIGSPPSSRTLTARNTGGWPMGVTLRIAGDDGRFCAHWVPGSESCGDARRARAKWGDTGDRPGDSNPGGAGGTGGGGGVPTCPDGAAEAVWGDVLVLDPGCSIQAEADFSPRVPEGAAVAGLEFGTVADGEGAWELDPRNEVQDVRLDAEVTGDPSAVDLAWQSGTAEFPWHPPDGSTDTLTAILENRGPGDATVTDLDLGRCASTVAVTGLAVGDVIAAGTTVPVQLDYTATGGSLACILGADTDRSSPAYLSLVAYPPAASAPPTVTLAAPAPGSFVVPAEPLDVDFTVSDDVDAPSTLEATVRLNGAIVLSGAPADPAGHELWTAYADTVPLGPVTVEVSVEDFHHNLARTAVTVRVGDPPPDDDDADGDGWGVGDLDCDDGDATIYPYAVETENGRDDDCNGVTDEQTAAYDDDGDSVSEAEGDCDDGDVRTYPGAPEGSDLHDNDCDGVIDNATARRDDDGDGYPELAGDCDDSDPAVHPFATELCDGIDNDCDGLKDSADECEGTTVVTAAFLDLQPDGCVPGETVTATLAALPAESEVRWSSERGTVAVTGSGPTFTLECPPVGATEADSVAALVVAPTGENAWAAAALRIYPEDATPWGVQHEGHDGALTTPCNPSGAAAFSALIAGVLGAAALRRRRE